MKIIATNNAPAAIGPYSQGIVSGSFAYCSGQIPVNPADGTIPEGIEAQAHQSCKNVAAVLAAGGTGIDKVVKTTCFLADMADFATFNSVYAQYFTSNPARSCCAVNTAQGCALRNRGCRGSIMDSIRARKIDSSTTAVRKARKISWISKQR